MGNSLVLKFFVMPSDDGKGPKKLGDPDDKSLTEVESKVLIKLLEHHIILLSKCKTECNEFDTCSSINMLTSRFRCSSQRIRMNNCIKHWDGKEELVKESLETYLAMRAEYRRTGIDPQLPFATQHEDNYEI